jgi:hypothetical protein
MHILIDKTPRDGEVVFVQFQFGADGYVMELIYRSTPIARWVEPNDHGVDYPVLPGDMWYPKNHFTEEEGHAGP